MNPDMDYDHRLSHNHTTSTFGIPPSIAHALSSHHTSHSSHPMSSDRLRPVHQYQHKKSKLDIHDHGHGGGGRGHAHTEDPSPVGGGNEYTFPPPSSPSFRHPQHPSSSSPSASSLHQVPYGNPQYPPAGFYSTTPPQPVPPSFMHSQADISSSRGRSFTNPTGTAYSPQSRSRPSNGAESGGSTGDILAAYLDTDPSTTRRASSTGVSGAPGSATSAFGIDWPATSSSSTTSVASPSTATTTSSAQSGPHWLDFLSGNGNASAQGHAQSHHSATSTPIPSNPSTSKLQTTQNISWSSRPGSGRNSSMRRSASGEDPAVTIQLFGPGAGEVKKEG